MGLAIINQLANYTLERKAQNVIPLDSTKRIYLTSVTNFAYNLTPELDQEGNLIYRLQSLNVGTATQPYVYSLENNPTGASVDPISGVVTVTGAFTGTSLNVILSAVYDNTYYILSGNSFQANALILNILAPVSYSDLRINNFTYNTNSVTADGGSSGNPVLSYQYNKSGTTMSTGATVTYKMHTTSDSGATINSNGVVTIPSNSSNNIKVFIVEVTVTIGGLKQTEVARISLAASESLEPVTPVTYTYAFSNVNLSYTGSPVAATGNSTGLTPTLNYTLTKTGSDNSTETISASSVVYAVNGTKPSNVTLTTSTGKVTFGANGTDDPVSVTIKATLTAPDGTTTAPTASITLDARALTSIAFDKYDGNNTIEVTAGDTIYANKIGLVLTYDTGSVTLAASADNNILIANSSVGTQLTSLTLTTSGTYTIYIYYKSLATTTSAVVNSAAPVTKAYIEGAAETPYKYEDITINGDVLQIPLTVTVNSAGETLDMKFSDYLLLPDKETYSAPVVTLDPDNVLALFNVDQNGTLIYNFADTNNYVFDYSTLSKINITCTSDNTKSVVDQTIDFTPKLSNPKKEVILDGVKVEVIDSYKQLVTDYFDNEYTAIQLNHADGISTVIDAIPAEAADYVEYVTSNTVHVSSSSSGTTLKLSGSGVVYKLKRANIGNDFYLKVNGHAGGAIISGASLPSSGTTFTMPTNNANYDIQYFNADVSNITYVHHVTSKANTYIIDLWSNDRDKQTNNVYGPYNTWYLLIPKENTNN